MTLNQAACILVCATLLASCQLAPQASGRFQSGGLEMSYTESGSGDALVLVAGGPGSSSAYLKSLVALLDDDYRVIVFDPRGTGLSRSPTINGDTVNVPLMIQDLEALRSHLGLNSWSVLGHSFGSLVAMRYAALHPGAMDYLILLASVSPTDYSGEFEAALLARTSPQATQHMTQLKQQLANVTAASQRDVLFKQLVRASLAGYFHDPSRLPLLLADAGADGIATDVFIQIRREIDGYDITAQLREIAALTLIVQGADDPMTPALAARTRAAIPGATLVILPNAGHFAWLEAPEPLLAEIHAFLTNRPSRFSAEP